MISIASIVSGTALALVAVSNFGWTTVDPCKLITSAELQGVLGVAFGAPEATDADPWRNCTYWASGHPDVGFGKIVADEEQRLIERRG